MKTQSYGWSDKRIMNAIYLTFAIISSCCAMLLKVPLTVDETGVVANAAFLAGDDWSFAQEAMGGSYFKAGMAILYYPLYLLFRSNPQLMYSSMIVLNALLMSLTPVFAYALLRKHLHVENRVMSVLISVAATGIPSIWLYASYAKADVALIFLPWPILLLLLEAGETTSCTRRKVYSVLIAFLTVYDYFTHTRGIVLLITVLMTVSILSLLFHKRTVHYPIYIGATILLLLLENSVSNWIKEGVWRDFSIAANTMETLDVTYFFNLLTRDGCLAMVRLILGWLFNIFSSTYGLVLVGLFVCMLLFIRALRKQDEVTAETTICLFAFLNMAGSFALGILFFYHYIYDFFIYTTQARADKLLYGRYTVCAVGMLCLLALYVLIYRRDLLKKSLQVLLVVIQLLIILLTARFTLRYMKWCQANSRYFISMTTFFTFKNANTCSWQEDYATPLCIYAILSTLVMAGYLLITDRKAYRAALALIIAVSCCNLAYVFTNVRLARDRAVQSWTIPVKEAVERIQGSAQIAEEYPCIASFSDTQYHQFVLPSFNLGRARSIAFSGQPDFLIIGGSQKSLLSLDQTCGEAAYYQLIQDGVESPLLVRGENLARRLIELGNTLVPLEPYDAEQEISD